MATFEVRAISPVYFNESYRYRTFPPATAEDFNKGTPVELDTGEIKEVGDHPGATGGEEILGFTTAAEEQYDWAHDTFEFVEGAVPVALATGVFRGTLKGTFAAADVGSDFGMLAPHTNYPYWVVNRAETTDVIARIVGVDDEVEVGDVDVPVRFIILPANRQVVS
jgi:hypothetical protein